VKTGGYPHLESAQAPRICPWEGKAGQLSYGRPDWTCPYKHVLSHDQSHASDRVVAYLCLDGEMGKLHGLLNLDGNVDGKAR